jgi:hypothetical protein
LAGTRGQVVIALNCEEFGMISLVMQE